MPNSVSGCDAESGAAGIHYRKNSSMLFSNGSSRRGTKQKVNHILYTLFCKKIQSIWKVFKIPGRTEIWRLLLKEETPPRYRSLSTIAVKEGIADGQRQLIYELVNTFLRMGEGWVKKSQAGSAFHGMDGRILPGTFFSGKDHELPQWHPGFPQVQSFLRAVSEYVLELKALRA